MADATEKQWSLAPALTPAGLGKSFQSTPLTLAASRVKYRYLVEKNAETGEILKKIKRVGPGPGPPGSSPGSNSSEKQVGSSSEERHMHKMLTLGELSEILDKLREGGCGHVGVSTVGLDLAFRIFSVEANQMENDNKNLQGEDVM